MEEIANVVGGQLIGDPTIELQGLAPLDQASSKQLSFVHNPRYVSLLKTTSAGAVILGEGLEYSGTRIICQHPHQAYAKAMQLFHPISWPKPSVSPQAFIAETAHIEEAVHIEAFAWIGEGAVIGKGSWIQSGVRIGAAAEIGQNCRVMANAVVNERCLLGAGVWINPGAVIGGEGFGFSIGPDGITKIPQLGIVVIEEGVEIGANSCVDRATFGETRIGAFSKLDNFVQIGHGANLGSKSLLVAYAALAGSAKVGKRVLMAGRSSVLGHVHLKDDSQVGVLGVVNQNRQGVLSGFPAMEHRKWLRAANAFKELPRILKRLRALEKTTEEKP